VRAIERASSDPTAVKPANKAEHPAEQSAVAATAAEPVERRAETKGNASQQSTCRTQSRVSVSQPLARIRQAFAVVTRGRRSYGTGRRRLWHLHRPYELMETAPCCKSMISAEGWPRLIRSRPWCGGRRDEQDEMASEWRCSRR